MFGPRLLDAIGVSTRKNPEVLQEKPPANDTYMGRGKKKVWLNIYQNKWDYSSLSFIAIPHNSEEEANKEQGINYKRLACISVLIDR